MAKYEVTFSCGHKGEVQLLGPGKDRERKLAWYAESGLCPDCYRAQAPKGYVVAEIIVGDEIKIGVDRSFEIREGLKARGYRFDGQRKMWVRSIPRSEFAAEFAALEGLGAAASRDCEELIAELVRI